MPEFSRAFWFGWVWLISCLTLPAAAFECDRRKAHQPAWVVAACESDYQDDGGGLVGLQLALDSAREQARMQLPRQGAGLWREHTAWLAQRDACGADTTCLEAAYLERLATLSTRLAVPTDAVDARAAKLLQKAMARQRKLNRHIPIDKILQPFALQMKRYRYWDWVPRRSEQGIWMERVAAPRPASPWAELKRAADPNPAELSSFSLVDVDGDGLHDLIIENYFRGSGLMDQENSSSSSFVDVFLRRGNRYMRVSHRDISDPTSFHYYELDGNRMYAGRPLRTAHWIRLLNRVYTVYVEPSDDDTEKIILLRPATLPSRVAEWSIP